VRTGSLLILISNDPTRANRHEHDPQETDIQKDAANAEGGAARHSAALSLGATHSEDVTWTSTRNLAPVSKLG
jgi:hypothetical protein